MAVEDIISARDRLTTIPGSAADSKAQYSLTDWLMLPVCDLGRLGDAIREYRWTDVDRAEIRAAAVELGGRVLGFVEQVDAEDRRSSGRFQT